MSLIWFCVHDGLDGWMAGWTTSSSPNHRRCALDLLSLIANRKLNRQLLKDGGPPSLRCSNWNSMVLFTDYSFDLSVYIISTSLSWLRVIVFLWLAVVISTPPPKNDQTQKTLYCFKSNKILYVFIGDISGYSGYITSIFGFKTSCSLYRSVKIQGRIVEMKIPLGYKELGRKIKKRSMARG